MADRYVVAAGGNWNATGTWATSSGGAGGASVPTSADNVFCDAASGNLVVNAAANCLNFDCTGYTGTLSGTSALSVYGSFTLSAGMTRTFTGAIDFRATSGSHTFTTAGKTLASNIVFGSVGPGATWTFQDAVNASGSSLTLAAGHLDTNGQTCSFFSTNFSGTNVRALTLGASVISFTGAFGAAVTTNFTFNAGTSTLNFAANTTYIFGNLSYYDVNITGNNGTSNLTGAASFRNLSFTNLAGALSVFALADNLTITGTLKLLGNSIVNRFLLCSSSPGAQRNLNAAAIDATSDFVDFRDINMTGAAFAVGTFIGDCLGNTNITTTTPAPQTYVGAAGVNGAWNNAANWTSRVPLPQDDVLIAVSWTGGVSRSLSINHPRIGRNIVITSPTAFTLSMGVDCQMYGTQLELGPLQVTANGNPLRLQGRSATTIRSNGGLGPHLAIEGPGSTVTLLDSYNNTIMGGTGLSIVAGMFDANDFNITFSGANVSLNAGTVNAGNGLWTIGGTTLQILTPCTFNAEGSSFLFTGLNATGGLINFSPISKTMNNVEFGAAVRHVNMTAAGSPVFNTFTVAPDCAVIFATSQTITAAVWNIGGSTPTGNKLGRTIGMPGSYFSTPDSVANSVTGDVEMRFRASQPVWPPTVQGTVFCKHGVAGLCWSINFQTNSTIRLDWVDIASNVRSVVFDSHGTAAANATREFKITLDVDNGAGGHTATLYEWIAGVWAQVGVTKNAGAFTTSVRDLNSAVAVGAANDGGAQQFIGHVEYAEFCNGIGGTIVAGFYPNDYVSGNTWVSSSPQGETWTRNGGAGITKAGMVMITNNTNAAVRSGLTKSGGGSVVARNLSVVNSDANPGTTFFAVNGIDNGNNLDWTFGSYADRASAFSLDFSPIIEGECVRLADADFSLSLDADAAGIAVGTGAADFSLNLDAAIVGEEGHLYADGAAEFDLSLDFSGTYFQKPNQRIVKVPVERDYLRVPTWNN